MRCELELERVVPVDLGQQFDAQGIRLAGDVGDSTDAISLAAFQGMSYWARP